MKHDNKMNNLKFRTPEARKALCDAWCKHREQGFSQECFPECDHTTFWEYVASFPEDFDKDKIDRAEKENQIFWEKIGIQGTQGKKIMKRTRDKKTGDITITNTNFNPTSWIFNMKNRFNWSDKLDLQHGGSIKTRGKIEIVPTKEYKELMKELGKEKIVNPKETIEQITKTPDVKRRET